jgi:hypothetical protein
MKLAIALLVVLAIDVMFFMGQTAITDINPTGIEFYNYENGSVIGSFDKGGYVLENDVKAKLPDSEGSVNPETGNIFTDTFNSIKDWFVDTTGIGYVIDIVNAVPNFLKSLGFPVAFSFALGALWHAMTLFLIVAFMWGRL